MRITVQFIHELSVWLEYVAVLMNHPDFPFQAVETDTEQDSGGTDQESGRDVNTFASLVYVL